MVVGTAERHIQIFNLTTPTTVYKASHLAWLCRTRSLMNILVYDLPAQVANPSGHLFPFGQRIRHWNNRGSCRYPVRFPFTSTNRKYLIVQHRYVDDKDAA